MTREDSYKAYLSRHARKEQSDQYIHDNIIIEFNVRDIVFIKKLCDNFSSVNMSLYDE